VATRQHLPPSILRSFHAASIPAIGCPAVCLGAFPPAFTAIRDAPTQTKHRAESVMWEIPGKLRSVIKNILADRRTGPRVSPGASADWLPPVLGPGDWSIGIMADRSAGWYFERDRR
jgi:hypothetical protein